MLRVSEKLISPKLMIYKDKDHGFGDSCIGDAPIFSRCESLKHAYFEISCLNIVLFSS